MVEQIYPIMKHESDDLEQYLLLALTESEHTKLPWLEKHQNNFRKEHWHLVRCNHCGKVAWVFSPSGEPYADYCIFGEAYAQHANLLSLLCQAVDIF